MGDGHDHDFSVLAKSEDENVGKPPNANPIYTGRTELAIRSPPKRYGSLPCEQRAGTVLRQPRIVQHASSSLRDTRVLPSGEKVPLPASAFRFKFGPRYSTLRVEKTTIQLGEQIQVIE